MLVVGAWVTACGGGTTSAAPSCCAPEPRAGQLTLQSYDFPLSGNTGSLHAVLGVFKPQNVHLQQVQFDERQLTSSNSSLDTACGTQALGTFVENECTVSLTFGPSLPPPPEGSIHTLKIVENTGASWSFRVRAGALNEQHAAG
jgi:hypothetical protein